MILNFPFRYGSNDVSKNREGWLVGVWDGDRWDPSHTFRISSHSHPTRRCTVILPDGGWWYVTIPLLDQSCRIFYAPSDIVRLTKRLGGFYKMVTAPRVAQPKLSKGWLWVSCCHNSTWLDQQPFIEVSCALTLSHPAKRLDICLHYFKMVVFFTNEWKVNFDEITKLPFSPFGENHTHWYIFWINMGGFHQMVKMLTLVFCQT